MEGNNAWMHGKMYACVVRSVTGGGQEHNKAAQQSTHSHQNGLPKALGVYGQRQHNHLLLLGNSSSNLASSLFEEADIFSCDFFFPSPDRRFLYSVIRSFSFSRFPVYEDSFLCKS